MFLRPDNTRTWMPRIRSLLRSPSSSASSRLGNIPTHCCKPSTLRSWIPGLRSHHLGSIQTRTLCSCNLRSPGRVRAYSDRGSTRPESTDSHSPRVRAPWPVSPHRGSNRTPWICNHSPRRRDPGPRSCCRHSSHTQNWRSSQGSLVRGQDTGPRLHSNRIPSRSSQRPLRCLITPVQFPFPVQVRIHLLLALFPARPLLLRRKILPAHFLHCTFHPHFLRRMPLRLVQSLKILLFLPPHFRRQSCQTPLLRIHLLRNPLLRIPHFSLLQTPRVQIRHY